MSARVPYEYAVIRIVPKVEREEFINVGVVLMSKKKRYLGIKYHLDKERIQAFSPEIDLNLIKDYLEAWEKICIGGKAAGTIGELEMHVRFRWLTANRSTIIQSSTLHPGLSSEPAKVLEQLFERYVLL